MHATDKLSNEVLSSDLGLTIHLMNANMDWPVILAFDTWPDKPIHGVSF